MKKRPQFEKELESIMKSHGNYDDFEQKMQKAILREQAREGFAQMKSGDKDSDEFVNGLEKCFGMMLDNSKIVKGKKRSKRPTAMFNFGGVEGEFSSGDEDRDE